MAKRQTTVDYPSMTQVISQKETLPCVMVSTKYKKRLETGDRDRGTPKLWNSETMGLGPWPWNYGITPKLLRNWGTVEFRNYSEITPKLGTVELWNYSEITPKLGNRGIPKLLRNYSETMDRDYGIPKLGTV